MTECLPSWRPGPTMDAILAFLDGIGELPADERVAYVDNDGTMWCGKPTYVRVDFFVDALRQRTKQDRSPAGRRAAVPSRRFGRSARRAVEPLAGQAR